MAFAEDLSVFFDSDDFAQAATYDGGAEPVYVIFDRAYVEAITGIVGTSPVALAQAADIPAAGVGKALVISGTTYTIRRREPHDDGAIVQLHLEA